MSPRGYVFHAEMSAIADAARKGDGVVRVGLSGTRNLDEYGREAIENVLDALDWFAQSQGVEVEIVQGGCVGADAYAGERARMRSFRVHTILPVDRSRVPANWSSWSTSHEEGGVYRERNKKIVRRAAIVFVVADYPEDHGKSRRSGTWMTARMAKEAMKPMWTCVQHQDEE
jgi:hypothetical protein